MFSKIKFNRNFLLPAITAVLCAVCLMVSVTCSLEGSIESLRLKATGNCSHIWGEYKRTTEPTCKEQGYETRYCQLNPAHIDPNRRPVAALGHDWDHDWDVSKSTATCTEPGYETRYCKRDPAHTEKRDVAALGHSWKIGVSTTATCLNDGIRTDSCRRCNITREIREGALGHDWGNWVVIVPATTDREGTKRRTCNRCNSPDTQSIPRL